MCIKTIYVLVSSINFSEMITVYFEYDEIYRRDTPLRQPSEIIVVLFMEFIWMNQIKIIWI